MAQIDGATTQAQDKAQEVAGQAKEQATQVAGQAKDQARAQIDQRTTQAGEQVRQQAQDIRTVAEQLREQGKDGPAKVAEQAADRAEKLGSYLADADADRILGDVEDLARKRPWMVVAGGVALGLAASRFVKASQTDRYRMSQRGINGGGMQRTGTPGTPPLGTGTGTGTGVGTVPGRFDRPATGTGNELSSGVGGGTDEDRLPGVVPTGNVAAPGTGGI